MLTFNRSIIIFNKLINILDVFVLICNMININRYSPYLTKQNLFSVCTKFLSVKECPDKKKKEKKKTDSQRQQRQRLRTADLEQFYKVCVLSPVFGCPISHKY